MPGWESWVIALSIGIVALMFVLLVIFLVITLVSLCRTLKTANSICADLEAKVHSFDPLFNVVHHMGDAVEKRTGSVRQLADEVNQSAAQAKEQKTNSILNTALEVAEWTLIGLALWKKVKERR